MSRICRVAASSIVLVLAACGGGGVPGQLPDGGVAQCQRNRDCPSGQGCVNNACVALPCGGCQPDEACADNGACVPAQGATCPQAGCPTGYSCTGTFCAKPCTLDADCPAGAVCNPSLAKCAQCVFDSQCAGVAGKHRCDGASGTCVACTQPIDCAHGSFCDTTAHTCTPGCKVDGDCAVAAGEKCDLSAGTPGRCIQCKVDLDCYNSGVNPATGNAATPACDSTGHCVACTADKFCPLGTPRCDTSSKTCVQCLASNNNLGSDCGCFAGGQACPSYAHAGDTHDAATCNSATHACVNGCQFDVQCGCPIDPATGKEGNCVRAAHTACYSDAQCAKAGMTGNKCAGTNGTTVAGVCQDASGNPIVVGAERCDTALTKDASGAASLGACAECLVGHNEQCAYRVKRTPSDPNFPFATLSGSRCVNDVCVEGCDSTADCAGGKICHLSGNINDPNNHKCVDCTCDGTSLTDNAWCIDGTNCATNKVCDSATLTCRSKRFAETCSHSVECGDTHDPALQQNGSTSCSPVPALCVKEYRPDSAAIQSYQQCRTDPLPLGRCGIPCDDMPGNYCVKAAGTQGLCPYNSACRAAKDDEGGSGPYCVAPSCF